MVKPDAKVPVTELVAAHAAGPPPAPDVPVLVYAPGLGETPTNTADGVADVLASLLSDERKGEYTTTTDVKLAGPKGLRVGKTIIYAGKPALQLFELDYKWRLQGNASPAVPSVPPGIVKSSAYAVAGLFRLILAARNEVKTFKAKFQLALGFVAVGLLVLASLVALVSALEAAGVPLPGFLGDAFGDKPAAWTVGILGLTVLTWTTFRKLLLGIAATVQQAMAYIGNDERRRDTVVRTLGQALDGLRENGWGGKIHLLGYSFGALAMYDALFPPESALQHYGESLGVASLATAGFPLDAVRLYYPEYCDHRVARVTGLPWTNIFIPADVFGSNLHQHDDAAQGEVSVPGADSFRVTSLRYSDEKLGFFQLLAAAGFRSHGGYWSATGDSCFRPLLDRWVPKVEGQ